MAGSESKVKIAIPIFLIFLSSTLLFPFLTNSLTINEVIARTPAFHLINEIYVFLSGSYEPISNWLVFEPEALKVNKTVLKVGEKVTIMGNGSESPGLNADKVDGLEAADLLAGTDRGEYRIYYNCSSATQMDYCPPYPTVNVPLCPPGWEEVYYRDGLTDPGYTYYPGWHLISDGDLTCSITGTRCICSVAIQDGSGSAIKYVSAGKDVYPRGCCTRINCGYRVCKKI